MKERNRTPFSSDFPSPIITVTPFALLKLVFIISLTELYNVSFFWIRCIIFIKNQFYWELFSRAFIFANRIFDISRGFICKLIKKVYFMRLGLTFFLIDIGPFIILPIFMPNQSFLPIIWTGISPNTNLHQKAQY